MMQIEYYYNDELVYLDCKTNNIPSRQDMIHIDSNYEIKYKIIDITWCFGENTCVIIDLEKL